MNLNFYQNGRQFFFITLAVAGRKKILSKIVEGGRGTGASPRTPAGAGATARAGAGALARAGAGATARDGAGALARAGAGALARVEPTALGERVIALWLKLHALCPALTASNFIIMPDHIHLLLMVDFSRLRGGFNPLVFIHWFRDWSNRLGETTPVAPRNWVSFYQPEAVSRAFDWEVGFWLDLAIGCRHLKTIRRYIKLNPARALWKQRHPDRFKVVKVATRRLLGNEERGFAPNPGGGAAPNPGGGVAPNPGKGAAPNPGGGAAPNPGEGGATGGSGGSPEPRLSLPPLLTALGNITLLGSPFLLHVRLTLKKTVAEHAAAIEEIVEKARRGYVPVSGFISPGEKEVLRRLKADPLARFIRLVPYALPPRYDPSAEDSRELAADRLAIVSLQPETAAIRSLDIQRSQSAARQFRRNCLEMNALAAALCERA